MRDVRTAQFRELFDQLPEPIREQAQDTFWLFVSHPSLRHHQLKNSSKGSHAADSYSVSITMQYRAIYRMDGETRVCSGSAATPTMTASLAGNSSR